MIWDKDAKEKFNAATHFHICQKEFKEDEKPVRDHCHFTGEFRGAAHESCNLEYMIEKERYKLPVLFHNLRGYDSHLLFQKLNYKQGKISVIPNNSERYISFTAGRLKFLDSMQFLTASLETLASQLSDTDQCNLSRAYPDPLKRKIVSEKGIYCYDYMDSMKKFDETKLPT